MALSRPTLVATLGLIMAQTLAPAVAAGPLTYFGFDEAAYSPMAKEGLNEIFAGHLFHGGVPTAGARLLATAVNRVQQSAGFAPGSPEGRFYSTGQFPSPPTRQAGVDPAFGLGQSVFMQDGTQQVTINCFLCHAGVVRGQVVAGLGNNHINQPSGQGGRTRGDNFGPYGVWLLGARLIDPAKRGLDLATGTTELQRLFLASKLAPVDPMPWWLMKYKAKDYWYADAAPDDAASFSINFTTPHPEMNALHEEHVQTVAKALAFARETESPPYPDSLDAELVRKGADLFHGRAAPQDRTGFRACSTCHGSYTKAPTTANYGQPGSWTVDYKMSHVLRDVKTDSAYNDVLRTFKPIADHLNGLAAYSAAQGAPEKLLPRVSVPSSPGYVAPPLVGVWASAPYFHNGSVPTLDTVLDSARRPEIWARNARDPFAYDLDRGGMAYTEVSREEFEASAARAKSGILTQAMIDHGANYDTKDYGHANTGHTFGDHLSSAERRAVIEFLKSLSGPHMPALAADLASE